MSEELKTISPLLVLALGTAASEDLTCIAAGVLIAQGAIGFGEGVTACLTGIISGDLLLFLAGRWLGGPALQMPWVQRLMPAHKVGRASAWLQGKGLTAVLFSRFTPGLRMATYFAAGSLQMPFRSFASYFLLASFVWTPLLVGSTVLFGERLLRSIFTHQTNTAVAFSGVFGFGLINLLLSRQLSTFEQRERLAGCWKRLVSRSGGHSQADKANTQMCASTLPIR
jgi:membrane protein DedA with SNARE-associated domain